MSFLSSAETTNIGFASIGENVLISAKASFYCVERISIGNNVRIDDYCVLSAGTGGIDIGSYIHIAVYCSLIGAAKIALEDFANLSSRVSIYSSSDDYSGRTMTNPMVPDHLKTVDSRPVRIGRHSIIGSGSVILPGVTIDEGVAVGALSLVDSNCESFGIYAGIPINRIGDRRREILELEAEVKAATARSLKNRQ